MSHICKVVLAVIIFTSNQQCIEVAGACTSTVPYEVTTCRDSSASCLTRCFWEDTQTSVDQFNALTNLSITCEASNWKKAGSSNFANWCDGVTVNNQCVDDIIYDPCTGELWQTPDETQYTGSYWYGVDATKKWDGIVCDEGEVGQLDLSEYRLGRTTACNLEHVDMSGLEHLTFLKLSQNTITGSIPTWLGSMPLLTTLTLSENQFSGSIPDELLSSDSIASLVLDNNRITGSLPVFSEFMTKVELQQNSLSGSLFNLQYSKKVNYLDISDNSISGFMPNMTLATFSTLLMNNNQLSGPLTGLDSQGMIDLETLDIKSNKFNGTLPSVITDLDQLEEFLAGYNYFSGFLPVLPASLLFYSFYGPNTSYLCPFPDEHEAWLDIDCTCGAGYYCPQHPPDSYFEAAGGTGVAGCEYNCTACEVGHANNLDWVTNCTSCDLGQFASVEASKTCSDCLSGSYANSTGSEVCSQCPRGKASDMQGTIECLACSKGFYAQEAGYETCDICPFGKIASEFGAAECLDCPLGKFSVNSSHCLDCLPGSFANETGLNNCTLCEAGTRNPDYGSTRPCEECSMGTYASSVGSTTCLDCPLGTYGDTRKLSVCKDCSPGKAQNETGKIKCDECGPGKRPNTNAEACEYCPAGKEGAGGASERYISISGNIVYCDDCDRGYYSEEGAVDCIACDAGYVAESEGLTSCTACPTGKSADGTFQCSDCPVNEYTNETAMTDCVPCKNGYVAPQTGSRNCTACPAGKFWESLTGAWTHSDGWELNCSTCAPGTYYEGNAPHTNLYSCPGCPVGRYTTKLGQIECDICESGKFMDVTGATACDGCPSGRFNNDSATEASKHDNLHDCDICGAGTYNNKTGLDACLSCPKGRYMTDNLTLASEHDDVSDCSFCPQGRYGAVGGLEVCTACPAGKYTNETGGNSLASCSDCSAGQFNGIPAAIKCSACPNRKYQHDTGSSFCRTVLKGYYFVNASSLPRACPSGYYSSEDSSLNCSACSPGYTSKNSPDTASTSCRVCRGGTYAATKGSSICADFPAGYASNKSALTSYNTSRDACYNGYYASSTGSLSCTIAPAGKYVPGKLNGVITAYDAPISCPAGTYTSSTGSTSCSTCPGGYRCSLGSSSPIACARGYYSDDGASVCTKCARGHYQPNTGKDKCIACPAGYYSSSLGSFTSCTACPYLTVAVANGSSACGTCTSNTFPNLPLAATSCIGQCDDGYIATSYTDDGEATCEACPVDTYQADTSNGAGECIECPEGYDTNKRTAAIACSLESNDDDIPPNKVAGFDLNEPTQAGSFYSVVGAIGLIILCALILGVQHLIGKRNDKRRAHEKMSRVTRGIWEESLLLSIPEAEEAEKNNVKAPSDNPYHLIKTKRLKTKTARRAVEGAFIEEGLKENPPPGCQGFVVVAASVAVRQVPNLSSSEMCRKYRGDIVYACGAADGWVQLHESHGELHGALGWISVKKHPNKLSLGVSPLSTSDDSQARGGVGSQRVIMFAARMARAAGMHGSAAAIEGLDRDGFTPLKQNEEEAEVNLEPFLSKDPILDIGGEDPTTSSNNQSKGMKNNNAPSSALRKNKKITANSAEKLMGHQRRPTMVLTAISEGLLGLGSDNQHLRSKKATKGWWVSLSSSLGMYADDEEAHAILRDHEDDAKSSDEEINEHDKEKRDKIKNHQDKKKVSNKNVLSKSSKSNKASSQQSLIDERMRDGFVDDKEREVTTALLAARANVSVVRVIEMSEKANQSKPVPPPPPSHLPPAADRLTRPPLDIPEPPILPEGNTLQAYLEGNRVAGGGADEDGWYGSEGGETPAFVEDDEEDGSKILGLFAEFKYEVVVKSLDVKTLPNASSVTKKTLSRGDILYAVESRGGWLKLADKRNGAAGGGWVPAQVTGSSLITQSDGEKDASLTGGTPPPRGSANKRKSMFQSALAMTSPTSSLRTFNNNMNATIGDDQEEGFDNVGGVSPLHASSSTREIVATVRLINPNEDATSEGKQIARKSKRKSIVNFSFQTNSSTNEPSDEDNKQKSLKKEGGDKWHMPKKVAVVRVTDDSSLLEGGSEDLSQSKHSILFHKHYKKNNPSAAAASHGGAAASGGGISNTDAAQTKPLFPPPSSSSLPAVFALFSNSEADNSISANQPGGGGGVKIEHSTDAVLSDLLPLDLPLPPQPCPAALSLMDFDQLPAGIRAQFKKVVMDKNQLEILLAAARSDPRLIAASRAAKLKVDEANKEGQLL